ncbi:hypothetical protein FRC19_008927 [Serendipita sp. 401]|nr:hypothetical protein FRC19_008927 [Serendipita sp. 401]KAG8872770.1 hypothetical protein FRC20_009046 [Serendipita sp. 405]KAG9048500.1 hypothetical protein FS842_000388 [Serendipita sp. 407]
MFWWLSFLRPPQASATSDVEIIPQISNDLRTEQYPHPVDIYYTWSSIDSTITTEPVKLTTYRPENIHKLLSVPVPNARRHGDVHAVSWSLGLCVRRKRVLNNLSELSIPLGERGGLDDILPVYSAPISLIRSSVQHDKSSKNPRQFRGAGKLDEIRRIFLLPASVATPLSPIQTNGPAPSWRSILISEKTSFDLDKKIWDSGIGLAAWLVHQKLITISQTQAKPVGHEDEDSQIHECIAALSWLWAHPHRFLELGAGSGIVSVVLSALLSTTVSGENNHGLLDPQIYSSIHATDLPSALPLINRNVSSNCRLPPTSLETSAEGESNQVVIPSVGVLDWDDDTLPGSVLASPPDVIIMSDVTYNTDSFPALLKTLKNLLQLSPHARVILAYKERHEAERSAWPLFTKEAGIQLRKLDEIPGAGGAPVEIWFGSL